MVNDGMQAISKEFNSIYLADPSIDETSAQKYHNANFEMTKLYGKQLYWAAKSNRKINGEGIIDMSIGINGQMLTYTEVFEIVKKQFGK